MSGPAVSALGPSSAGAQQSGGTSITWTHVVGASDDYLVVCGSDDGSTVANACTLTVGGSGTGITHLESISPDGSGGGWGDLWVMPNPPTGSQTLKITGNSNTLDQAAGSVSFTGATGHGTPATTDGPDGTASVTLSSSTVGYVVIAMTATGNIVGALTSPSGGTEQITNNAVGSSSGSTGFLGVATAPSTGGSMTFTWSIPAGDTNVCFVVEVQGPLASAPTVTREQATVYS